MTFETSRDFNQGVKRLQQQLTLADLVDAISKTVTDPALSDALTQAVGRKGDTPIDRRRAEQILAQAVYDEPHAVVISRLKGTDDAMAYSQRRNDIIEQCRVTAQAIYEGIAFPITLEDHSGWESLTSPDTMTMSRTLYFEAPVDDDAEENDDPDESIPSVLGRLSFVFDLTDGALDRFSLTCNDQALDSNLSTLVEAYNDEVSGC